MNYYQLITDIRKLYYGESPSTFSDISGESYYDIVNYLKNANSDFLQSKGFQFRKRKTTFSTVENQQEYINFYGNVQDRGMFIATSDISQYICHHGDVSILLIDGVINSGRPVRYGIFNNKIVLHPIPDDEYGVNVLYDSDNFVKQPFSIDSSSASGQKSLYLSSTTGITAGNQILVEPNTIREEIKIIDTIATNDYVTLTENLTYTHGVGTNNVYLEKQEFEYETDEPNFPAKYHKILIYEVMKRLNFNNASERDKYIGLSKQVYADILRESRGTTSQRRFCTGD